MTHEKIFSRPDKSNIKVQIDFMFGFLDEKASWNVTISCRPFKCKKFHYMATDYATPAEILETKLELWQKLKPE